ncbi:energy-coupling factor ABC transporter ATP-binding protein [Candidatus Gottesmanbacteria bacterium]|nr:energy-coupling factor ABC transporter ATP-binding protein [Candidatus Gottesmanbacteria bacterium]
MKKIYKKPLPIINLKNITYSYQGVLALNDISFSIKQGEKVAFLGANGSGKSTLLKILDGLIFATNGTYQAFGNVITQETFSDEKREYEFRRKVGYVFQDSEVQLFNPSVWDEVCFAPLYMGFDKNEAAFKAERVLRIMNISHLKDRIPHQLSGGEKKKVAIASILSYQPEVWLFDEPTAGLDPRSQSRLIDFICQLDPKQNTVITASHDIAIVREIADRIIVLSEDHRIVTEGSPEKILSNKKLLTTHNLIHEHLHQHKGKKHTHIHSHLTLHKHSFSKSSREE